jgi:hypothetical protein
MKEKTSAVFLIGAVLIGIGVGYILGAASDDAAQYGMHTDQNMGEHMHTGMESAMHDMTEALEGKTGAAFDQAFLEQMIVHHAGAVDMAAMVQRQSGNAELKVFAQAIAVAQTKEIEQMRAWRTEWNMTASPDTPVSSDGDVSDSSGGGSAGGAGYGSSMPHHGDDGDMVACTMEAKICPDGSAVGRQGPRCEFAKCPGE